MQKYQDVVLNQNGNPIAGAQITVTDLLGTPVAVYATNSVGLDVNPVTSDSDGRFSFYAPDGRYSLVVRFGGNVVANVTDILLEDPQDGSDAVFGDVTINGTLSDASKISSTPAGGIAATNVQAALDELDTDKASTAQLALKVDSATLAASGGSELVGYLPAGTGAVATNVQSKLREFVSVKDFGAVGDGVTDDTAAIQAAITAAGDNPGATVYFPKASESYLISSTLTVSGSRLSLVAEDNALITTSASVDMLAISASNSLVRGLHLYRSAGTGKAVVLTAPECKLRGIRVSGAHSVGVELSGAYLTTFDKCYIAGCGTNIKDLGTSQASELLGCNIYGATGTNIVWESADLTIIGGAVEFSTGIELAIGLTNQANVRCYGVHFEGLNTATERMIVIGTTSVGNRQLVVDGCSFFGNAATRIAIQLRGVDGCRVANCYFAGFDVASTLIDVTNVARNITFLGNKETSGATLKSINASASGIIDFETPSTGAQSLSITHGSSGGSITGVQSIKSSARTSNLVIDSLRNSANAGAIDVRTPGADNATLFSRIQCSSGADVGKVTFPSATVEVSGTYTAPFKIGSAYFWMNAGKFYLKDGSMPTTATDGTVVGTQT